MGLREGDAWNYLKAKSLFKPSDCNALFSDGRKLPVLIRPDTGQLAVEIEDRLFDQQKLPTFTKFELKPEEILLAPPTPPEPTETERFEATVREEKKLNPNESEWVIRRRVAAQFSNQNYAAMQKERQAAQSSFGTLPDRWASFAAAAKKIRNSR